ncbi:MAG: hypothetical protein HYV38_03105 [Candidatus Levybacteria bacterium]|nr:hypothetical protein [Candidatus Levybacteria bacterium]
MVDTGSELPNPPPSVLENPRMKLLVEDEGIQEGDFGVLESLGNYSGDLFAEFFHNRFNRDHERDASPRLEKDYEISGERLAVLSEDDYRRKRLQASHEMFGLFLPILRKYGRATSYRLVTFFEDRENS